MWYCQIVRIGVKHLGELVHVPVCVSLRTVLISALCIVFFVLDLI